MTAAADGLVTVHLLELPVPLAARATQHFEELQREFALMAATGQSAEHETPVRLLSLVAALTAQYGGVSDEATQRLDAAIDRQDDVIADHVLHLPAEAAGATQALADMIEEADEYCRQGRHLLTLATPDDCVAYRRWYLGQVLDQLAGRPARPWSPTVRLRAVGAT